MADIWGALGGLGAGMAQGVAEQDAERRKERAALEQQLRLFEHQANMARLGADLKRNEAEAEQLDISGFPEPLRQLFGTTTRVPKSVVTPAISAAAQAAFTKQAPERPMLVPRGTRGVYEQGEFRPFGGEEEELTQEQAEALAERLGGELEVTSGPTGMTRKVVRPRPQRRQLTLGQSAIATSLGFDPANLTPEQAGQVLEFEDKQRIQRTGEESAARTRETITAQQGLLGPLAAIAGVKAGAATGSRIETEHALRAKLAETAGAKAAAARAGAIDAELQKTPGGIPRITERQAAVEAGRPVGAETQNKLKSATGALGLAERIRTDFSPEQIEKWVGLATAVGAHGGNFQAFYEAMQADPEFTRFKVLDNQMATYVFDLGGKQLTPFEASVVFAAYPTLRGKFTGRYYLSTLDEFEKKTRRDIAALATLATTPKGELNEALQKINPAPAIPKAKTPGGPPGGFRRVVPR